MSIFPGRNITPQPKTLSLTIGKTGDYGGMLTAWLPDQRWVEAELGYTPDGNLYKITIYDDDPRYTEIQFWGRPLREVWDDGAIPPWEWFVYRVPIHIPRLPQERDMEWPEPELVEYRKCYPWRKP